MKFTKKTIALLLVGSFVAGGSAGLASRFSRQRATSAAAMTASTIPTTHTRFVDT